MNSTRTLAHQQRDLLNAIFATNNIANQSINTTAIGVNYTKNSSLNSYPSPYPYSLRGLKTYQANASASALRSLKTAYPVIAQLIGDTAFEHLAHDFWAQHPPTRGDLTQWGSDLTKFISSISALQTEPYLSDVAKAEWALHTAATAADQVADLATFSLLTEQNPDELTLQFSPGTALIDSTYPIASILTAHLYASPSFEEVGIKLRQNRGEIALIWRQGLQPRVSVCTASEAVFMNHLFDGKSLLKALDTVSSAQSSKSMAPFNFSTWLSFAAQNGLLVGAQLL
jgi:Putative DNA-binding domain